MCSRLKPWGIPIIFHDFPLLEFGFRMFRAGGKNRQQPVAERVNELPEGAEAKSI